MFPVFVIAPHDEKEVAGRAAREIEKYVNAATQVFAPRTPPGMQRHEWVLHAFEHIADEIERGTELNGGPHGLRNSVAFVELSGGGLESLKELNPVSVRGGWPSVVAMLVLAFPEIHWCFHTPYAPVECFLFEEAHGVRQESFEADIGRILTLHNQRYLALFDPTGLRSIIRDKLRNDKEEITRKRLGVTKYTAPYVPVRPRVAAVLDEEEDYALLNAYTAYRFGYRVHTLTSFRMLERVLTGPPRQEEAAAPARQEAGEPALKRLFNFLRNIFRRGSDTGAAPAAPAAAPAPPVQPPEAEPPLNGHAKLDDDVSLIFEDLYLNFPDTRPGLRLSLSDLQKRDGEFKKLPLIEQRIFITVGHQRREEDRAIWADNDSYLKALSRGGIYCKTIYKPGSGVFDIWLRSGLARRLAGNGGRAEGYEWPPRRSHVSEAAGGHSAPGRLLLISNRLLQRASRVLRSAGTVPDAVYGAVVALEAQEYLGHRTPTVSLEALALKHQLEVLAECMFYGVEYNMDVKSRFQEIENDVTSISEWFKPRTRKLSKLNAEIRIVSELLTTFREHSQFDEEQKSLARIRELHRRLWFSRNKGWAWLLYPVRWYVEFLLGSVLRFVFAILLWIGSLSVIYGAIHDTHPDPPELARHDLLHGISDAVTTFLGMQPPHDFFGEGKMKAHPVIFFGQLLPEEVAVAVTVVGILASFVHFGIFISHLYSVIARR